MSTVLTNATVRRVAYEAERALLVAQGRGGLPEWHSLPDSVRASGKPVHPAPFHRSPAEGAFYDPEQNRLRRQIYDAIVMLLGPQVDPLSAA